MKTIKILGDYAEVPLSKGYVAKIDIDDVSMMQQKSWVASWSGNKWYGKAARNTLMHRFLLGLKSTDPHVDHINGDGLDNRRSNLRLDINGQNNQNAAMSKNNTSGYKGVTYDKKNDKWVAQIAVKRKHITIGRFQTPKEAAIAYNEAALLHFGEFAKLNEATLL